MYSREDLIEAVSKSSNINQVIKNLGLNKSSGTYNTIKKRMGEYGITQQFGIGERKKYTDETIFCENSTYDRSTLRNRIIRENKLRYRCSICNVVEWNNKPMSLQLDHINGVNNDNRLENLRFLCPNCHTQTSTWGNKN